MIKDNRQRLFEMMNRVGGMPIIKEQSGSPLHLPTWAASSAKDFIPLEDYEKQVPCATNVQEVERDLNPNKSLVNDPIKWMQDKDKAIANGVKQDVANGGRLSSLMMANSRTGNDRVAGIDAHNLTTQEKGKVKLKGNADFDKVDYDLEELGRILNIAPADDQIIGQNGKMGKTNFYNITLPAYRGIYYDNTSHQFYVINVCDKADTCAKICFAQMGNFVKNDPVVRLNAQKLNYLLNNAETWKNRIVTAIKGLNDGFNTVVVRWHDSGDFFSEEYMKLAFEIANETQFAEHYAYTKEVGTAKRLESIQPENFEFKFSLGGLQDNLIKMTEDAHAVVVPKRVFGYLQPDEKKWNKKEKRWYVGKGWKFSDDAIIELKQNIIEFAKKDLGLDIKFETLKTHEEMKLIGYKKNNPRVWNVISMSGDSDVAALRKDVLGIYMLIHK